VSEGGGLKALLNWGGEKVRKENLRNHTLPSSRGKQGGGSVAGRNAKNRSDYIWKSVKKPKGGGLHLLCMKKTLGELQGVEERIRKEGKEGSK